MRPLLFVAAAALVFAATTGSASAEEQFSTLAEVSAAPMSPAELASVRGGHIVISILTSTGECCITQQSLIADGTVVGGFEISITEGFTFFVIPERIIEHDLC